MPPDTRRGRPRQETTSRSSATTIAADDTRPVACPCCGGVGWSDPATLHLCDVDHHQAFDFAGCVLVACPHCHDRDPVVPLRPPCESVEQASELLAPLAAWVLAGKYDELGIHVSELRQQRAMDRLERILDTGHYRRRDDMRAAA